MKEGGCRRLFLPLYLSSGFRKFHNVGGYIVEVLNNIPQPRLKTNNYKTKCKTPTYQIQGKIPWYTLPYLYIALIWRG